MALKPGRTVSLALTPVLILALTLVLTLALTPVLILALILVLTLALTPVLILALTPVLTLTNFSCNNRTRNLVKTQSASCLRTETAQVVGICTTCLETGYG